jgi:hypothetical protein
VRHVLLVVQPADSSAASLAVLSSGVEMGHEEAVTEASFVPRVGSLKLGFVGYHVFNFFEKLSVPPDGRVISMTELTMLVDGDNVRVTRVFQ